MFEKVNPEHPDKIADRIAGALVDLAYKAQENPRIAVEVLLGHGQCTIIAETSVHIDEADIIAAVKRIAGAEYSAALHYYEVPQDAHLADNQSKGLRCGDNGIFKGSPITDEQQNLTDIAKTLYAKYHADGKYLIDNKGILTICQSNASTEALKKKHPDAVVNPLGDWTGGLAVDSGATNRKLGSDMGDGVTGGGLHGKDLSKADVSVNIYAHLMAQKTGKPVEFSCSIGDEWIGGVPYSEIVEIARKYIKFVGGFEKFAEWGLIC